MPEHEKELPSTSNGNGGERAAGEDLKPKSIDSHNRASTETLVLDTCYATPEDIQRDLESPLNEQMHKEPETNKRSNKSLRDFITYAEPLTPMLQEVLHDFSSDDSEPNLQIVENSSEQERSNVVSRPAENVIEAENTEDKTSKKDDNAVGNTKKSLTDRAYNLGAPETSNKNSPIKISPRKSKNDLITKGSSDLVSKNMESQDTYCSQVNNHTAGVSQINSEKSGTQNYSSSITDTLLPANQEALQNKNIENKSTISNITEESTKKADNKKRNLSRKRANSDTQPNKDKIKKVYTTDNVKKSNSETGLGNEDTRSGFKIPTPIKEQHEKDLHSNDKVNVEKSQSNDNEVANEKEKEKSESKNDCSLPSQVNPCLNNVSLFAEQFNNTKYLDSESDDENVNKIANDNANTSEVKDTDLKNTEKSKPDLRKTNAGDVVILKSHSESESDMEQSDVNLSKMNNKIDRIISDVKRDKALASVFGFSSGKLYKVRMHYEFGRKQICMQ